MPSATPPRDQPPWREFLSAIDKRLSGPVQIHCLGGFVVTVRHGRVRMTGDLDYIEIVPPQSASELEAIAGERSDLAKKYGVRIHSAGVADLPDSYKERLAELFPSEFTNLRLLAVEAHDLALSKLTRNLQVDREDVEYLAKRVPLDPALLKARYERELRPIVMGDVAKHDQTLKLWLEAYF
jgi:hypothetical protein